MIACQRAIMVKHMLYEAFENIVCVVFIVFSFRFPYPVK